MISPLLSRSFQTLGSMFSQPSRIVLEFYHFRRESLGYIIGNDYGSPYNTSKPLTAVIFTFIFAAVFWIESLHITSLVEFCRICSRISVDHRLNSRSFMLPFASLPVSTCPLVYLPNCPCTGNSRSCSKAVAYFCTYTPFTSESFHHSWESYSVQNIVPFLCFPS